MWFLNLLIPPPCPIPVHCPPTDTSPSSSFVIIVIALLMTHNYNLHLLNMHACRNGTLDYQAVRSNKCVPERLHRSASSPWWTDENTIFLEGAHLFTITSASVCWRWSMQISVSPTYCMQSNFPRSPLASGQRVAKQDASAKLKHDTTVTTVTLVTHAADLARQSVTNTWKTVKKRCDFFRIVIVFAESPSSRPHGVNRWGISARQTRM